MAVVNTWTISTDPGFQTRRSDSALVRETDHTRPKPRIKPEAMMIAIKNQGSVAQLFNPYSKPPSFRSRSGVHEVKRNFIKENTKQIKTIQKSHRESESVSSAREPLKVLHKSDKYEHIESKVAQEVQGTPKAPRSKSITHKQSRSGSSMRDHPVSERSVGPFEDKRSRSSMCDHPVSERSVVPPEPKHSPVSQRSKVPSEDKHVPNIDIPQEKTKQLKVNHISKNIRQITSSSGLRRRAPSAIASEELERKKSENEAKYKRGKVPSYLRKRQEQWKTEEEERIKNMPDPSIPPGHTLMPRDERLQTLDLLRKKQKEMTRELNSLPVSCDTLRIKQRKMELENKLREIENALKIFSRPKVFVKIDS